MVNRIRPTEHNFEQEGEAPRLSGKQQAELKTDRLVDSNLNKSRPNLGNTNQSHADKFSVEYWLKFEPETLSEYLDNPKGYIVLESISRRLTATPDSIKNIPIKHLSLIREALENRLPNLFGKIWNALSGDSSEKHLIKIIDILKTAEEATTQLVKAMPYGVPSKAESEEFLNRSVPAKPPESPVLIADKLQVQRWLQLKPEELNEYLDHPEGHKVLEYIANELTSTRASLNKIPTEHLSSIREALQNRLSGDSSEKHLTEIIHILKTAEEAKTQLVEAMSYGMPSKAELEKFLTQGADPDSEFPTHHFIYPDMTLAQAAMLTSSPEAFKLLLKNRARFEERMLEHRLFRDDRRPYRRLLPGITPEPIALPSSQTETFKLLFENGADPNARFPDTHWDYPGMTLAQIALLTGNIEAFKLLIKKGAEFEEKDANYRFPNYNKIYPGMTLTQVTLQKGNMEAFKLLVEKGANPNVKFPDNHRYYPGMTLAQFALLTGDIEAFKLLLENKADPKIKFPENHWDYPGMNLAQVALLKGNMEAFKLLFKRGAKFEEKDANYQFPASHLIYSGMTFAQAVLKSKDPSLIRALIDHNMIPYEDQVRLQYRLNPQAFLMPVDNAETIPPLENAPTIEAMLQNVENPEWRSQFLGPEEGDFTFRSDVKASYSREQVIEGLRRFLETVSKRAAFLGTPRADQPEKLNQYYNIITQRLQHIFTWLKNPDIDTNIRSSALTMIFNGSTACGTAWFNETKSAYDLLKSQPAVQRTFPRPLSEASMRDERQEDVLQVLYHFRKRCFITAQPENNTHIYNTHTYNAYMRDLGKEFGVAGPDSYYDDPLASPLSPSQKDSFRRQMDALYNPLEIIQELHRASQDKTQIGSGVIPALLSNLGPRVLSAKEQLQMQELERLLNQETVLLSEEDMRLARTNKEEFKKQNEHAKRELEARLEPLRQKQKKRSDFEEKVFDQETFLPTQEGIKFLLVKMGLLSDTMSEK